jgi:hypothetical protein
MSRETTEFAPMKARLPIRAPMTVHFVVTTASSSITTALRS